jgi:hypothetical protein
MHYTIECRSLRGGKRMTTDCKCENFEIIYLMISKLKRNLIIINYIEINLRQSSKNAGISNLRSQKLDASDAGCSFYTLNTISNYSVPHSCKLKQQARIRYTSNSSEDSNEGTRQCMKSKD